MNSYIKVIYMIYLKYTEFCEDINESREDQRWIGRNNNYTVDNITTFRIYVPPYTGSQLNKYMKNNGIKIV